MLSIEQYGVKLIRLQKADIELVRNWRNQNDIINYMEYRNFITPEAQEIWFDSINNKCNYYFIIEFEEKKVGLINAKNFDATAGFGEGGIFIGEQEHINSFAAVFSTLCLLNFVFHELKLCDRSRIRILKTNDRAIHYNKLIGYKLLPGQEDVENQLYELSMSDYDKHGEKLNKIAGILSEGKSALIVKGERSETNIDEINQLLIRKGF